MATRVIEGSGWTKVCKGNNCAAVATDAFRDMLTWGYEFLRSITVTHETLASVLDRITEERKARFVPNGTDEQLLNSYGERRAAQILAEDAEAYCDYVARGRKDLANPMFQ